MKKISIFALVLLTSAASLSMLRIPFTDILNGDDYKAVEIDARRGSALSAPLDGKTPYWESFNRWQCFPADQIETMCLEADYGTVRKVPAIHVSYGSHLYEFSMDPEPEPDCEKILDRWKQLLAGEDAFCTFAAFLQDLDTNETEAIDGSVWIINQLKTRKGYWSFEADENWIQEKENQQSAEEEGSQ